VRTNFGVVSGGGFWADMVSPAWRLEAIVNFRGLAIVESAGGSVAFVALS
jgi:hypothetical protein